MEEKEYFRLRKGFMIGIVCAIVTALGGEIPIGWTVYPKHANPLIGMIMGCGSLSNLQLASGALFGGIGIPLQYYGYRAVAEIVLKGNNPQWGKMIGIGAKAIAFWGGIVHIICVSLMFVCKMENTQALEQLPQNVIDFTCFLVLPISIIFMAIYFSMTIAIMIPVIKGRTIFPRWAFFLNPIFMKGILNSLSVCGLNTAFINGIRMSNMGLGSLVTFCGLLLLLDKYYKEGQ